MGQSYARVRDFNITGFFTEHASSSQSSTSTTATTSSATSMTSLDHDHEHEHTQNTTNTNSDGDWDWEGDWGDMETQPPTGGPLSAHVTTVSPKGSHNPEQWTSLEEKPEEEAAENQEKDEPFESGWEDGEFQPLDDFQTNDSGENSPSNKVEDAAKKREERRLARQRQLEAKRAAKLGSSLLAKKI